MNPYLENPEFWPEVHHLLISLLAETLNPQLLPKYRVAIEKRVYTLCGEESLLVGVPDATVAWQSVERPSPGVRQSSTTVIADPLTVTVPMPIEVREGYLEVREVTTQTVVTAIELLSPANKRSKLGREAYEQKRRKILGSQTHLVEIDLIRTGEPLPIFGETHPSHYRILLSRSPSRPVAELYSFNLTDPIPLFPLPLSPEDREPILDLHGLLDQVYDRAGYSVAIHYEQPLTPPLTPSEAKWVEAVLSQQGLRHGRT
jgi:hypothetical protein